MITARFTFEDGEITGFEVSGHSGYADPGCDIVCAAVSSAVSLCECAINDVIGAKADVKVDEACVSVSLRLSRELSTRKLESCINMLKALNMHLKALKEDYPKYIEVLEV